MGIETNQLENSFKTEQNEIPKFYSKKAILGFSIFFSSIFGGILLIQNLKEIGMKKEAKTVLNTSVILTVLPFLLAWLMEKEVSTYTFLVNIIGGLVLSEFYFGLYIPKEQIFESKKIWKPLLISLLIIIPILASAIYFA
jgi:heme/copper-type cytochrome/quinol oxidase subunit 4